MPGVDITTSFKQIDEITADYFTTGNHSKIPDVKSTKIADDYCYGIDDVFAAMQEECDYPMLHLALKFMSSLYPVDLFMFFDELSIIEERLFSKYEISYNPIRDIYNKYRNLIEKSYIDFIIEYHREATAYLFAHDNDYTLAQMKFLMSRNKTFLEVLPDIGKKISRRYYETYVVDNTSSEFGT